MVNGVAGVLVAQNGGPAHEVAKLHSGDYFGEMSLLTGDPRSATIVAESDCEVLEIDKAIFGEIVASNPELLRKLSEVLSTRRLEMEGVLASKREPTQLATLQQEYSANLLKRISAFFEL
jgi:CRP-like cAMP-binding protein